MAWCVVRSVDWGESVNAGPVGIELKKALAIGGEFADTFTGFAGMEAFDYGR